MKTAHLLDAAVRDRLHRVGVTLATLDDARVLRRAEKTLHRWAELECGDDNGFASFCIERDEMTNEPYMVTYPHAGSSRRRRIADRENGALRRVATVCQRLGAFYFHQTDPRGVALYVGIAPLTDTTYNRDGVAITSEGR